jgi:hypothetical protein
MYEWANVKLEALENRLGRIGTASCVGLGLILLACVYVRPGIITDVGLGQFYAELARDPFAFGSENRVAFRFLTPLISYLVGLRGELIVVTNLVIALLFIVSVYACYRKTSDRPVDAALAAAVVSFSLVTLTTIYYGGFCDSLTYVIIFFMWWWRRKALPFWVLFVAGIFNREAIVFLLPWFLYIRFVEQKSVGRWLMTDLFGLVTAGLVVLVVRRWLGDHFQIEYDSSYYWSPLEDEPLFYFKKSWGESILGLFTVFKLLWVIPIVAFAMYRRERNRVEMISVVLLFVCASSQLLVAFDSSRMLTLGFMSTMIAMFYLMRNNSPLIARWSFPLLAWNLVVPQVYTAGHYVEYMHSLPGNLIMMGLFGKDTW